ncbi:MAG TPA: asparagine synthase (glutamine-hydrolyzing), partial [Steroidobacteraceae bacterium]|nr:asparagine synthase (glutamine-hydrolyzing) [Steroidobacteraceae bacterium]
MCGIAGIVTRGTASPEASAVIRMRDAMAHRGPDGAGIHIGPGVGLGHRRLSIIDVAAGHQPMFSDDRRYAIVYNGEVFNHPALMRQLQAQGVRYQTRADTETVLHLFERDGTAAVQYLRGMFAFAIWDSLERKLFLARDRFGIKPLYYFQRADGSLVFASEVKGIFASDIVRASLNKSALPDYLANHAPSGAETLFEGIKRLAPGHTLVWHDGEVTIERYWDLLYPEIGSESGSIGAKTERQLIAEFSERFTEAVRLRLMSDVPLGMFLSGGIDSAAITATMAPMVKEPIKTFSVGFAEREANELEYARLVSQAFHTEHREVVITPEQFFAALPKLIWHEDEPLAHPSSVALYFVARLAARHVKVVLTGEGSDEMLAGYNRYRVTEYNMRLGAQYTHFVPATVREAIGRVVGTRDDRSWLRERVGRTFLGRAIDLDSLYFDNFAVFDRLAQLKLLLPHVQSEVGCIDPYLAYHQALSAVHGRPLVSQLLYADAKTYLHELLMKQDQMSMAASIESRVPFLDHPFAEWLATLPQAMKLRGVRTKWILREAMKDALPAKILGRRKMGFPVPIGPWLRGSWRHLLDEFVLSERAASRGLFDRVFVEQLVGEHLSG